MINTLWIGIHLRIGNIFEEKLCLRNYCIKKVQLFFIYACQSIKLPKIGENSHFQCQMIQIWPPATVTDS